MFNCSYVAYKALWSWPLLFAGPHLFLCSTMTILFMSTEAPAGANLQMCKINNCSCIYFLPCGIACRQWSGKLHSASFPQTIRVARLSLETDNPYTQVLSDWWGAELRGEGARPRLHHTLTIHHQWCCDMISDVYQKWCHDTDDVKMILWYLGQDLEGILTIRDFCPNGRVLPLWHDMMTFAVHGRNDITNDIA